LSGLESLRLGHGFSGSPGAAVGMLVFKPEEVVQREAMGNKVVLCMDDATYDDEVILQVLKWCFFSSSF
jgi:hypothetical protein